MKTVSAPAFETARSGERDARDCCAMSVSRWATSQIATRCARWPPRSTMLSPWYGATRRGRSAGSGALQDRARNVQRGGRWGPTRDDEGVRQWKAALEVDDLALDPAGEVRRDDHEMLLQLVVLGRIGRQLGAHSEQLALDAQDRSVAAAVRDQGPGRA